MERKMDFWTIEIATKFESKQEALDLRKNIIDKFNYECGVHKDYMAQVIVGVSNINGKYVNGIYNKSGKVGNNGRAKDIPSFLILEVLLKNKKYKSDIEKIFKNEEEISEKYK